MESRHRPNSVPLTIGLIFRLPVSAFRPSLLLCAVFIVLLLRYRHNKGHLMPPKNYIKMSLALLKQQKNIIRRLSLFTKRREEKKQTLTKSSTLKLQNNPLRGPSLAPQQSRVSCWHKCPFAFLYTRDCYLGSLCLPPPPLPLSTFYLLRFSQEGGLFLRASHSRLHTAFSLSFAVRKLSTFTQ